jgi:hypothetical protein
VVIEYEKCPINWEVCIVSHISGLSNAIYGNLKQKENILQMKKTTKDLRYEILKFGYVHNIYIAY